MKEINETFTSFYGLKVAILLILRYRQECCFLFILLGF